MKALQVIEMINTHDWLVDIAAKYINQRNRLKLLKDNMTITKIDFICNSDKEESFSFNQHVSIPAEPFLDAIDSTIDTIKKEIKDIEDSLPMIEFETKLAE